MKRSLLKSIFISIIAVLLVASLSIAGCKTDAVETTEEAAEETTEEAAEETVMETPTITLGLGSTQTDWTNETWVLVETGKVIDVNIDVIPIPHGDIPDKRSTMIAGQSLPDIMNNPDTGSYDVVMSQGPKGAYFPIDTIMDKIPNFKRWADKYPEFYGIMTADDGHIYALPRINTFLYFNWAPIIGNDVLEGEAMTSADIETMDDLFEAFSIIKDKTGFAPWISRNESGGPQRFLNMAVQMFGTGLDFYYNAMEDEYRFGPYEDNFKEMVVFLNKCNDAGLLNDDIFVMTDENYEATLANEEGFFYTDNMLSVLWAGPEDSDWDIILPPKVNGVRYYGTINQGNIDYDSLWTVAANTENIDAVAKFIDFIYSDAGNTLWRWGEEGYTWEEVDGRKTFIFGEEGWPYLGPGEDFYTLGIYHSDQNEILYTEDVFDLGWIVEDNLEFLEARQMYIDNDVVPSANLPAIFTAEENDQRIALQQPIITHTAESIISFIKGVRPIEEWDAFVSELEDFQADTVLDIYQTAFERTYDK